MQHYTVTITPQTAFATPLVGDTLFGQLCWSLREHLGEQRLETLLDGYTAGKPFLIVSDAFPSGHLPLPTLPAHYYERGSLDRKAAKKQHWLNADAFKQPLAQWRNLAKSDQDAHYHHKTEDQTHNTINRATGTTGDGIFAPYSTERQWYKTEPAHTQDNERTTLDLHLLLDSERLDAATLQQALTAIGAFGYGKDATTGIGKFSLESELIACELPHQDNTNACLTLARCAPQGQNFNPERSYYQYQTRFGRLGAPHVQAGIAPFKKPLMLAQTGAVFTPNDPNTLATAQYIGQGISGHTAHEKTVHQGYAPIIRIHLPQHQD